MNPGSKVLQAVSKSRSNYWLAYAMDFTCPAVMFWLGMKYSAGWLTILTSVAAGIFVFSFVEYSMHRWLFHAPVSFATDIHRSHHVEPEEPTAMPFPCSAGAAFLLWSYLPMLVGEAVTCYFATGFMGAFFYYTLIHHFEHSIRIRSVGFGWLRRKWIAHAIHHGRANRNYGVTTALWDHVFGTYAAAPPPRSA
jgi:sterol desaturase/sphingolipid hydroxylase (fatty acid hydroxylase superfamily)